MSFVHAVGSHPINLDANRAAIQAGQSFILGYAVNFLLLSPHFSYGLLGGVLSTTASLIDSVTRPLIAQFFDSRFRNSCFELITRSVIVLSVLVPLAGVIAPMMGLQQGFDAASVIYFRLITGLIFGPRVWDHQLYII